MNNSRVGVIFEGSCLKRAKVTFTTRNVVNSFIVSELDKWLKDLSANFTLKDCLLGVVKLTKNVVPGKYSY